MDLRDTLIRQRRTGSPDASGLHTPCFASLLGSGRPQASFAVEGAYLVLY